MIPYLRCHIERSSPAKVRHMGGVWVQVHAHPKVLLCIEHSPVRQQVGVKHLGYNGLF